MISLRAWLALIGLVGLMAGGWSLHHHGYRAGYQAAQAHYEPIMAEIARKASEALDRARATEEAAQQLGKEAEDKRRETEKALDARAAAAEQRITGLLSQLAAARHRYEVPGIPGATPGSGIPPEVRRRLGEIGSAITGIGRDAESDAASLAACQSFYNAQRALNSPP